jgi:MCP family monocarboxylic acid transporter-like MFS transporter 10
VLNASSILGRLLPSFLADRYGSMTVLVPHVCIAAVLTFLFPLFDKVSVQSNDAPSTLLTPLSYSQLSVAAFAILFGYCSGAWISLSPICVIPLGPLHSVGSRVGGLFSIMSIAGVSAPQNFVKVVLLLTRPFPPFSQLLGTPLAGLILGTSPNYHWWPMVAFAGSCVSIGLVFLVIARHFAARESSRTP